MNLKRLIFVLLLLTVLAAPGFSYTLSGTISGAEWFGGITYVYGFRVDTLSLTPYIGLALLGNGPYFVLNAPAGSYTLLAFQDRDGNLVPSIDDLMGFYGDTLPEIVEVTGNTNNLDIEVSELPFTTISGTITCPAGPFGLTLIQAASDPLFEDVITTGFLLDLTGNGEYSLFLDPGQYYVAAFLDADLSFDRSSDDPQSFWGVPNAPVMVNVTSQSAQDINLNLMLPPEATLTMTPVNPPIVISPGGGSFQFNITVANNDTTVLNSKVWLTATLPGGSTQPVLGPVPIIVPAGISATRLRTQAVPSVAPAGNYSYNAYLGLWPTIIWQDDSFPFSKSGAMKAGLGIGDWTCTGEEFNAETISFNDPRPVSVILHPSAPNPFNPTTTLRYDLQAAGLVSVKVFDTAGRLVASLANGWREAGRHEINFDGSTLASGVYLYTVTAGQSVASGKMVLAK
jgi:hypothetical protein